MKSLTLCILSLLLLSAQGFGQIEHQHTFDGDAHLVRYPGEDMPKYYFFDTLDGTARFFNLAYTPFQTINVPDTPGAILHFNYLSRQTFDRDGGKEFLVSYRDTANSRYVVKVYDEDRSELLSTEGEYGAVREKDNGHPKLLIYNHSASQTETKVYELGGNQMPHDFGPSPTAFTVYPEAAKKEISVIYGHKHTSGNPAFSLVDRWGDIVLWRRLASGSHMATFPIHDLNPGTYVARLEYGDGRIEKKMVVVLG